jgi:hypothetical protein
MENGLEWLQWIRAIWEAREHAIDMSAEDALSSCVFFREWMTDLLHCGRVYEPD